MNVEKLHAVVSELRRDYQERDLNGQMQSFLASLTNQLGSSSADGADQNAFADQYEALNQTLDQCVSNAFVPSKKRMLDGIGGTNLCGEALKTRIAAIFERGLLEQGDSVDELTDLFTLVNDFHTELGALADGFARLGIACDSPREQPEIGVMFSDEAIEGNMGVLGEELASLNQHLSRLTELTGGDSSALSIRAASDNGVELFISAPQAVTDTVSSVVTQVSALKEAVYAVTRKRTELSELGVPSEITGFIEEYETSQITTGLGQIAEDVLTQRGVDASRYDEFKGSTHDAVQYLAERMDRGVVFEFTPVASEVIDESDDEVIDDEPTATDSDSTTTAVTSAAVTEESTEAVDKTTDEVCSEEEVVTETAEMAVSEESDEALDPARAEDSVSAETESGETAEESSDDSDDEAPEIFADLDAPSETTEDESSDEAISAVEQMDEITDSVVVPAPYTRWQNTEEDMREADRAALEAEKEDSDESLDATAKEDDSDDSESSNDGPTFVSLGALQDEEEAEDAYTSKYDNSWN